MWKTVIRKIYKIYFGFITEILIGLLRFSVRLPKGRYLISKVVESVNNENILIKIHEKELFFSTPNWLTHRRATQILVDEPETISWIDGFSKNSVFWDIGANVGIYSIYAAVFKECDVVAFEPSFLNLPILHRNIELNSLMNSVSIFPVGLSDSVGQKRMYFSKVNFIPGGAHNSLGKPIDQYGNELVDTINLLIPAETLDSYLRRFSVRKPDYLKIDVDGLELEILQGGVEVLSNVKSVLIELLGKNQNDEKIHQFLNNCGLKIESKANLSTRNVIYTRC